MRYPVALLAIASVLAVSSAPGCAAPPEPIGTAAKPLTLGTGPAAVALVACICSTCLGVCGDDCADASAMDLDDPACKACMAGADPDGCAAELAAYQVENGSMSTPACFADNSGAVACPADFAPYLDCDFVNGPTENCISDGDAVCPAGYVEKVCCADGAAYGEWLCVLPSTGSGGAGGGP